MPHGERRKNTRVEFKTTATVRFDEEVYEQLAIRDLSTRGIFVLGCTDKKKGQTCVVDLLLSGASSELKLSMKGVVVRTDVEGVGIRLTEIDIDSFFHLKNIIYYNADDPDKLMEDELVAPVPDESFYL